MATLPIVVASDVLVPRNLALVQEIYDAACRVDATLPDTHAASITAKRLIAAFRGKIDSDALWLIHVVPLGTA